MFKKILQICASLMLLLILTTGSVFSDAFPPSILLTEPNSTHQRMSATDQTPASKAPDIKSGATVDSASTPTVKAPPVEAAKAPTLKAPKGPIDPYDYEALREADESIYGAGK